MIQIIRSASLALALALVAGLGGCMTPPNTTPASELTLTPEPVNENWVDLDTQDPKYGDYFAEMRRTIGLNWTYPKEAKEAGVHGDVTVAFALLKDGHAKNFKVISSSGYAQLDRATLDLLRGVGPFAGLPEDWGREYLFVSGTFHYGR